MAVREFNIPFGPDKTGGMGLVPFAEEEEVKDPFAEPPIGAFARESNGVRAGLPEDPAIEDFEAFEEVAEESFAADEGVETEVIFQTQEQKPIQKPSKRTAQSAPSKRERKEKPQGEPHHDDVSMSFAALRNSIGQSRELKAREREIEEFREQLIQDQEELNDRENILANYDAIIREQDSIIDQASRQREQDKADLSAIATEIESVHQKLNELHEYHVSQIQPLESDLGRALAAADQAKNDERSRKSELNAVENELRRAASPNESTMAEAKRDQIKEAYDRACDVSERAQRELAEVQRYYDDTMDQIKQAEGPLHRRVEELEQHEEELKRYILELGDDISAARKRRQYCEAVYQYPEETNKLRMAVKADEEALHYMHLDYDELADLLEQSKSKAKKAKLALGMIIVIVVIFIIALFIILTRSGMSAA